MSLEKLEKKLNTLLNKLTPEERKELENLMHEYIESLGNKLITDLQKQKPFYTI